MTERNPLELKRNTWWIRDARNPVLPPGGGEFDAGCCMNPWAVRIGEEYHLYYGGAGEDGKRRICRASAPVSDPADWTRHGPIFDVGPEGAFDAAWCVLPHVVEIEPGRWHCYYTANCGHGVGLSSFPGLGVAVSTDGVTWTKHEGNPILAATHVMGDPDEQGIAGGSVLKVRLPDGAEEWRFYYTGCPTLGEDLFLNQQKTCCLAVSQDGLAWERRGAVMLRDPDRDYENVAVAGPVVQQHEDGSFRMWYSAIGTRWGAYSICYAESEDGLAWRRGPHYGDNLQLGPAGDGWERRMVEYPSVIAEGGRKRLFYCGNHYGSSGIGTAVSSPLRATARVGMCHARIVAPEADAAWDYRVPEGLDCIEGAFKTHMCPEVDWHGPDANGQIWHEWETNDEDLATLNAYPDKEKLGLAFIQGIRYRVMISPAEHGLAIRFTAKNVSDRTWHNVNVFPCLGRPTENFHDDGLERTFIVTADGLTPLKDTDRGSDDPIRTHYPVDGMPPKNLMSDCFWGGPSATTARAGAILRTSADGRFTVGTAWETSAEIFQNEDAHHCIHSCPTLGDLAPGETKTVRGRIVLVQGGPRQALSLLEAPY